MAEGAVEVKTEIKLELDESPPEQIIQVPKLSTACTTLHLTPTA